MANTAQEATGPADTVQEVTGQLVTFGLRGPAPAATLLERLQVQPGASVLYLGCPDLVALASMADQVGPSGTVTVVDDDDMATGAARQLVIDRHLSNVEVLRRPNWHGLFEAQSFDVVHVHGHLAAIARRRRRRLMRRAIRLAKPGGWIVSREERSALDRSPWTVIRLFNACGLDVVSTEPAHDGALDAPAGGGSLEYLVWGRRLVL